MFFNWAKRWNISTEAIIELQTIFGIIPNVKHGAHINSNENAVLSKVRLEASRLGLTLWRNNTGAVHTEDGRFIRYGLANDSRVLNAAVKSADLVGINPIKMGDKWVGQFVAIEVKHPLWNFKGTPRERAQLKFLEIVESNGGRGFFIKNADNLKKQLTTSTTNT